MTTIGAALREMVRQLRAAGIETPELDARLLLEALSGRCLEDIVRAPNEPLMSASWSVIETYVSRRLAREPVSRIIGRRWFYGREFVVTAATLDPRPESETLIAAALAIVDRGGGRDRPLRVLDVGTGTGCLLLTLLAELPNAIGTGSDISALALSVARSNAGRLGLDGRTRWLEADLLDGIAGPFDLVVANPPYIPSGDIAGLAAEVRLHDPHLALDGGPDGLDAYRRIAAGIRPIVPNGWLLLELGAGQADRVAGLLDAHSGAPPAATIERYCDLAGHTRCVAWRPRD